MKSATNFKVHLDPLRVQRSPRWSTGRFHRSSTGKSALNACSAPISSSMNFFALSGLIFKNVLSATLDLKRSDWVRSYVINSAHPKISWNSPLKKIHQNFNSGQKYSVGRVHCGSSKVNSRATGSTLSGSMRMDSVSLNWTKGLGLRLMLTQTPTPTPTPTLTLTRTLTLILSRTLGLIPTLTFNPKSGTH